MQRTDLERARANLDGGFAAVGLQERFDETLLLFRRRLGWGWPFYVRENVTTRAYRRDEIDADDLARIRELNRLDIELHDWVRGRFDAVVAAEGAAFSRDLAAFRVLNRAWGFLARELPPPLRQAGGRAWRGLRYRRRA